MTEGVPFEASEQVDMWFSGQAGTASTTDRTWGFLKRCQKRRMTTKAATQGELGRIVEKCKTAVKL